MPYVLGKCTFYFNTGSEGDIESVCINGVSVLSRLNLVRMQSSISPGTKQTTVIDPSADTTAILN